MKAQTRISLSIDDRKVRVVAAREIIRNEYGLNRVSWFKDVPFRASLTPEVDSSQTSLPSRVIAMRPRARSGAFLAKHGMTAWLILVVM